MNRGLESGHKHVREDLLDLLYLVDFVERVFEVGICGIEIAQLRDSGFGDGFEVTNQVIEAVTCSARSPNPDSSCIPALSKVMKLSSPGTFASASKNTSPTLSKSFAAGHTSASKRKTEAAITATIVAPPKSNTKSYL